MHQSKILPYLLLLPAAVLIVAVVGYPMVYGISLSLTDRTLHSVEADFIGLENFRKLLQDDRFLTVAGNSVLWPIYTVIGSVLSGFMLALILNQRFLGRRFARGILLVPWTVPTVAVAFVWVWLYDPLVGIFNQIVLLVGGSRLPFMSDVGMAQFWMALPVTWRFYPFVMLMLLAGLQAIDQELYAAAAVDGANMLQRFWHITLPMVRGILGLVTVLEFIWLFNHFDIIWIMTGGGPADATHNFATYAYYQGFKTFKYAYASAIGVVMLVILFFSSLVYLYLQDRMEIEL
ncbi:MAG: sugar ABC transporter permease [Caldilineaceae bacterium]|nr:sugar ABC transporter permease [Caldilineaceae bacterium]MDE0428767.1 sugar ABC transporter permease [Caldilineaceae bacterium]